MYQRYFRESTPRFTEQSLDGYGGTTVHMYLRQFTVLNDVVHGSKVRHVYLCEPETVYRLLLQVWFPDACFCE